MINIAEVSVDGCRAMDDQGKWYIDMTSGGIFAAGGGTTHMSIWTALGDLKKAGYCSYSSKFGNYWRDRYVGMLKELTGFESVALFSTGAEACEAFWRCCRVYNNRPGIWGGLVDPDEVGTDKPLADAMHGVTLGALIMAGKMNWPDLGYFPELGAGRFGQNPNITSCMIMEPYHAASGQFHRMDPTIKRIQELQRTYKDIPLCMDEVQGGFGRTGKLWAHSHYEEDIKTAGGSFYTVPALRPDFVTIGKLCGGGLPLAALLGPKEIMESDSVKEFGHLHSTHSGNPVMCSVGCAVIEEMRQNRWVDKAAMKGDMMHQALAGLPVRVHGKGLMAGLEFRDRAECKMAVDLIEGRGVLVVDTGRKWIKLGPALVIPEEYILNAAAIIRECVEEIVHAREYQALGYCGQGQEVPGGDDPVLPEPGV